MIVCGIQIHGKNFEISYNIKMDQERHFYVFIYKERNFLKYTLIFFNDVKVVSILQASDKLALS